jgi:hypothetical protein
MFHFFDHAIEHAGTSHFSKLSALVWLLILLALTLSGPGSSPSPAQR